MKTNHFAERGQALVIIAIAAIALFAFVGLTIDGSAQFSDRRHAQNAADTAALAAALEKVNGGSSLNVQIAALNRANENGYTNDLVTSTVEVYNPPISGVYANCSDVHFDCNEYVQVLISSNIDTTFARVMGITQLHNHVSAVASAVGYSVPSSLNTNGIVALSSSGCAVITGGNGTLNITSGGIFSNSDSSCAFRCNGNTLTASIPSITTVGGDTLNGCAVSTAYTVGARQIAFPPLYEELDEPSTCSLTADINSNYTVTGSGSNKTATLLPGHYSKLPLQASWKSIILNPGIYCIDTTLDVNSSLIMNSGSTAGVLLYFKPSSSNPITVNGGAYVNIWGINSDNDPSLSAYTGFLMYFAPNYALALAPDCKFNGNASSIYVGTIYAPYCDISINGSAGLTMQSQLVGYTVDLSGNPGVVLDYAGAPHTTWVIPKQVGLSK